MAAFVLKRDIKLQPTNQPLEKISQLMDKVREFITERNCDSADQVNGTEG